MQGRQALGVEPACAGHWHEAGCARPGASSSSMGGTLEISRQTTSPGSGKFVIASPFFKVDRSLLLPSATTNTVPFLAGSRRLPDKRITLCRAGTGSQSVLGGHRRAARAGRRGCAATRQKRRNASPRLPVPRPSRFAASAWRASGGRGLSVSGRTIRHLDR